MLTRDELRAYCNTLRGVQETFPFGEDPLVFKVMGKMIALMSLSEPTANQPGVITLKCDPARAEMLRETYPAVQPGYYMNKRHWNTVTCDDSIPTDEIYEMIEDSYALVVKALTKAERAQLEAL